MIKQGKIIKSISDLYTVLVDDKKIEARCSGKIRNKKISPLVGDIVLIDVDKSYIEDILPRVNELNRPKVANIDEAIIVTSAKEPDFSSNLLDKQICYLNLKKIHPVILLTKLDLLTDKEKESLLEIKKYYEKIGIPVFINTEFSKLEKYLSGKLTIVTGQTGAGKSSFINKIGNYQILTNEISKALGRGKHTTRNAEIYEIKDFYIMDTPGFSALDLSFATKEEVRDSFIEFSHKECYFQDCMHLKEKGCLVKEEIGKEILPSRYENYKSFLEEIK